MSGYNYYEVKSCGCDKSGSYVSMANIQNPSDCLPPCMTRFSQERSVKDQYDYKFYVLGESVSLIDPKPSDDACQKK